MPTVVQHIETNTILLTDIFNSILDQFNPEYDTTDRGALVSLAGTCRALSDPSLDRLWRKLDSLKPLVRSYTTVDDVMNGITPPTHKFPIIARYARRIRDLTVPDAVSKHFLQCAIEQTRLLPNLQTLHWFSDSRSPHSPITLMQPLIHPRLASIEANLVVADSAKLPSLFDALSQCEDLESIILRFAPETLSAETIQALSRLICCQNALEKIIIRAPIDDNALKHLSTLPTVRVLDVGLPENISFPQNGPLFCGVEQLGFETSDLDLATSLLQPQDQIFHKFRLGCNNRLTSDAAATFFNALASRPPTQPLEQLTLKCGDFSHFLPIDRMESEASRYCLSYEALKPLMVFHSLRDLTIEWGEQISLDDAELAALASGWSSLRVFNLSCHRGGYPPFTTKYPTLGGLLSLVTSCQELRTVSLPLDATQVPPNEEGEPLMAMNIASLTFLEAPIDDPSPVAEFLFDHFPFLTVLDWRFLRSPGTDGDQITTFEATWQRVEDQIRMLAGGSAELDLAGSDESDEDELRDYLSDSDSD